MSFGCLGVEGRLKKNVFLEKRRNHLMMSRYKLFLSKLYLFQFFGNLMFIYPLYALMFSDAWMGAWEISFLFAVWSLVAFLFEIPSWALADTYWRKTILLRCRILKWLCFLIWLFRMSFRWFLVWLIIWWIGSAFFSWSLQAFVYDELVEYWKEDDYTKVTWNIWAITLIAMALASFVAMVSLVDLLSL